MKEQRQINVKITEAKNGSPDAFTALYGQYEPLVLSMAHKYCKVTDLNAEFDDLKQEAGIAFYSALKSYNTENTAVTFGLYAKICIRNRLVSVLRKLKRVSLADLDSDLPNFSPENAMSELYDVTDPENAFIQKENYRKLLDLIEKSLTPYEMSVFKLYVQGYSYRRIANSLAKTEKSVDCAISRIKSKLRNRLYI